MRETTSSGRGAQVSTDGDAVDPITQEVIRNFVRSTADEMGLTMMRSAYSAILIAKDFSTGIFDKHADIIGQAEYCPIHIASMQYSVKWTVEELGRDNINPGDMIIHNDPFRGGTHIADTTIIRPIFDPAGEDLVAFSANRAHQIDLGGMAAGGFAGDATDAYQEGIRIPPVKIWDQGEENEDLWKFLLSNVRVSRDVYGDMSAQIASNLTAEERIHELLDRYDAETFHAACAEIKDHSEEIMREEIRSLPDGTYQGVDYMDDDGITDEPYEIQVTVTVDGDELVMDFEGTDPEADGSINCPWTVTAAGGYIALLQLTDPYMPFNAGCFRPVHVLVPPGCFLNADHPAPTYGGNTETSKRVIDAIVRAFEDALPDRVAGANFGTSLCVTGGGTSEEHGDYAFLLIPAGGWGGRASSDGITAVASQIANTQNQPVEVLERKYPFHITQYDIRDDSEGPGEYRGGFGLSVEIELTDGPTSLNALFERCTIPPWGIRGGEESSPNRVLLQRRTDDEFRPVGEVFDTVSPSKFSNLTIREGDRLKLQTAGGGGYGDPHDRDPAKVGEDVRKGYISPERAGDAYGVEVDPGDGTVLGETPARRDS